MTESTAKFDQSYEALTGFKPYPWQRRLYSAMMEGNWPDALDIPTGLGKTSVLAIWLIALAHGGDVPRRVVYVVNRRTIVDQATKEAERLMAHLKGDLRDALETLSGDGGTPLSISTLRGQHADNRQWLDNPARPAIVVGTVDLIGSRLLFRGYRSSWTQRSFHTGLLGHDALIVHDEAHLSHPFQYLLEDLVARQKEHGALRPLRTLALSATAASGKGRRVHALDDDDRSIEAVDLRLNAVKKLSLHEDTNPVASIVKRATRYLDQTTRVLVYVRTPKDAAAIAKKLTAAVNKSAGKGEGSQRVALLTGTLRGRERDRLVESSAMRYFDGSAESLPHDLEGAVYLVSTSAGEVGVDLDADHMVMDLVPADALVQRLGRVNRRGGKGRVADVATYAESAIKQDNEYQKARVATLEHLQRVGARSNRSIDASPQATRTWVTEQTRSPVPEHQPLTDASLDALALTSIAEDWSIVPDVGRLLHGLQDEPAQTTLLWRDEVGDLDRAEVDSQTLQQVYRTHRPLSHEQVSLPTYQVLSFLSDRIKHLEKQSAKSGEPIPTMRAIVVDDQKWFPLEHDAITDAYKMLAYSTLVLPSAFGGLDPKTGMLDPKADAPDPSQASYEGTPDVADETGDRMKCLRTSADEGDQPPAPAGYRLVCTVTLDHAPLREYRFYRKGDPAAPKDTAQPTVEEHNLAVRDAAKRFVAALSLPSKLADAVVAAAAAHDLGKQRQLWQAAIHNFDYPTKAFAKSDPGSRRGMAWRLLRRYRHEFGSMLDAGDADDLTLHLIASHHGRARPHFPAGGFDPERPDSACPDPAEVAQRFARLQREHGHWGLSWLEAILRAADGWASRQTTEAEDGA